MTSPRDSGLAPEQDMRAGVSTFAFGWAVQHGQPPFDALALLAFAERHALAVVQLADNLPVHAMSADRIDAVARAAAAADVGIELGARGLTDAHLDIYLGLCRRIGAPLLRFVVDDGDYEPSESSITALLRNAVPALDAAGVTLAIENHDRLPAAALRRIVATVASPAVGICLDTANSLGAGEGLSEVARQLAAVTVNMHVKDVAIMRLPHRNGFRVEGRPLGRGQLPIREALARVRAEGRCRSVLLESWAPFEADPDTTRRIEAGWAHEGVNVLKAWLERMPSRRDTCQ